MPPTPMSRQIYRILFLFIILLQACKATKSTSVMEYYDPDSTANASTLNLPIKLYKAELENTINLQLGEVIYEDSDYSDGLLIKATRQENISIDIEDQKVIYTVPIKLWVRKDVIITAVDAEGALNLVFETAYSVQPDWELLTHTNLKEYSWTKTPIVKLGIGNLNVTSIANQFIEKAKGQIAKSIDDQVGELIDLKGEINRAWTELQKPILLSPDYNSWLLMQPDSLSLTPLQTVDEHIECTVVVRANPKIILGSEPSSYSSQPMPNFKYISAPPDEDFVIYFGSEIPFGEAERIAQSQMLGESFSYGRKRVKVENLTISGEGNKLKVSTLLSGSYEGVVHFTAKPDYNDRKNEITLKDVDFDFETKSTLLKTASWLFKGSLKKSIQENLNFHLNENLQIMQETIETQLENFELAPGVTIMGNLDELNVSHIYVSATSLNVKVGLKGKMLLEIKDLARK